MNQDSTELAAVSSKPKRSKKAKHATTIQESSPFIPAGLRLLVERSYNRVEPTKPEKPLPTVNVRFDKRKKQWAIFGEDGKTIDHFQNGVLMDVEFIVEQCTETCEGQKIDVDCGHARGKFKKGKPKSMPDPTHPLHFDKWGTGFNTMRGNNYVGNLKSAGYLILSADARAEVFKPSKR